MKKVQIRDLIFNDGNTKICVPLTGTSDSQILRDIENLRYIDFDLVELRIDYYDRVGDFDSVYMLLQKIRELYFKPMLFTFRTKREGGMHEFSEENYFKLNHFAVESGMIDLIDIELNSKEENIKNMISCAHENNVKVIMSNHDFSRTPSKEEIVKRLIKMQEYDADISKIAVMPLCEEDVLTLMSATLEMKKEKADRPFITMSMGSMGVITRLTGELFGSCLTFAALDKVSAPGQIDVRNARKILDIFRIQE